MSTTVLTLTTQQPPSTMAAFKPATSQQMRSRFFNVIGIESKLPLSMTTTTGDAVTNSNKPSTPATQQQAGARVVDQTWSHPRTESVTCFQEALKFDPVADRVYATKKRQVSPKKVRKGKRLTFVDTVDVVPIPMRTEYSNRVRSRLWSNAIEIHENAARNTIEFASEGWDWRAVTEDERMYVCVATGELIHPCHYEANFQSSSPS